LDEQQEGHLTCKEIIPKCSLLGNADQSGVTSKEGQLRNNFMWHITDFTMAKMLPQ